MSATIEAVDRAHDLALLKPAEYPFLNDAVDVNGRDLIPARHPATICPRTLKLRSGDPVFTIGHPLGDLRLVTTQGIVASDDGVQTGTEGILNGTYLVDMLINHGNSGGPVFYPTGNCVIGVVDSISLTPVEALGPNGAKPLPPLPLTGLDGKPQLDANGKPVSLQLAYSTGLATLIPQQFIIKLFDQTGHTSSQSVQPQPRQK